MRKLSFALAALAAIAVAAPTVASAEDFGVGVRVGGDLIGASSVNVGNFAAHAPSSVTTTAVGIAAGTGTAATGRLSSNATTTDIK